MMGSDFSLVSGLEMWHRFTFFDRTDYFRFSLQLRTEISMGPQHFVSFYGFE